MLLLIIEIGLTIAAWKRGWKGWALLPGLIAICVGFFLGLAFGATGGSEETMLSIALVFDVLCIITLAIMIIKPRRSEEYQQPGVQSVPKNDGDLVTTPSSKTEQYRKNVEN